MTSLRVMLAMTLAPLAGPLSAGSLGSEGSLGVSAGYQSNPLLLDSVRGSSESLSLLLYLPVEFDGRRVTFSLQPRIRAGKTHGAVAPLSDYQYLDSSWDYKGERNEVTLNGDWRRDSTLYNQFERSELGGSTLRRLEKIGSLAWKSQLTERGDFQVLASEDQVAYQAKASPTLQSFTYGHGSLKYDYAVSERWVAGLESGVSRYDLRDQSFRTDSINAQLDLTRTFSERWSMSMSIGSSRLKSMLTIYQPTLVVDSNGVLHIVYRRFDLVSRASTASYTFDLQRKSERWTLELAASRALQPSGFGALARQDDISLKMSDRWSERLALGATIHGSRLDDASGRLSLGNRRYYDLDLNADWRWTEHWTVSLQMALYLERQNSASPTRSNVPVFLTASRQFGRVSLN